MILAFRMGPAASGLCDIDRVFFKVAKLRVKKLGSSCRTEIYRKTQVIGIFYGGLPNF